MARHQLGQKRSGDETDKIVTFLGALTGQVNADCIRPPALQVARPHHAPREPRKHFLSEGGEACLEQ